MTSRRHANRWSRRGAKQWPDQGIYSRIRRPIMVTSRADRDKIPGSVYRPHQGARECARRRGAVR